MGLSKNDSDVLWEAVKTRKFVAFLCSILPPHYTFS